MGGSGWERMFHLAKIFTLGVVASLLGGKHVKRTRRAYLLTSAWLEILTRNACHCISHCQCGVNGTDTGFSPHATHWKTVHMYTKNCSSATVNEARRHMSTHSL